MKKCFWVWILVLALCGCAEAPVFETIADDPAQPAMRQEREMMLTMPKDVQTVCSDAGTLYLCDGFEMTAQVLEGGDLNATFLELTGFACDDLTVMATAAMDCTRYECVWTAAGEAGDSIGRVVVLDDGQYHYCLTATADAAQASQLQALWQQIFTSFFLS